MESGNNKSLEKLLIEYFESKEKYEAFLEDVIEKYNCVPKLIKDPLSEISKPDRNGGADYKKYLQWVQILHFVYKIPLENLNIEHNEVYDNRYSGVSKSQWLRDGHGNRLTGEAYEKAYLDICEAPLRSVKKNLWIYDYLGKTDIKEPHSLDIYFQANEKLYSIIESKLKEIEGFEYIRFLALPFDLKDELNPDKFSNDGLYEEAVKHFIKFCPSALLIHICNCLKNFPAIYTNVDPDFETGFYIVPHPSRAHHFALLDSGQYTFGEYYRSNKEGINRPDLLFLESRNETSELLTQVYTWEKVTLMKTPKRKRKLNLEILKKVSPVSCKEVKEEHDLALAKLKEKADDQDKIDNAIYAKRELEAVSGKHEYIQKL